MADPVPGIVHSRGFGLEVELHGFTCRALPPEQQRRPGPTTILEVGTVEPQRSLAVLRNDSDDDWAFRIDDCGDAGYLVVEPQHGRMLVARDGSTITCDPPAGGRDWDWQWFLIGHGLPLASLLRGRELLHACAVLAPSGKVIVVCGEQGWGKSTLALALGQAGCTLLSDDVVAIEARGDGVVAHPGSAAFNCDPEQAELVAWADSVAVAGFGVFYFKAMWALPRHSTPGADRSARATRPDARRS